MSEEASKQTRDINQPKHTHTHKKKKQSPLTASDQDQYNTPYKYTVPDMYRASDILCKYWRFLTTECTFIHYIPCS